jgi:hypothetical protein
VVGVAALPVVTAVFVVGIAALPVGMAVFAAVIGVSEVVRTPSAFAHAASAARPSTCAEAWRRAARVGRSPRFDYAVTRTRVPMTRFMRAGREGGSAPT